MKIIRLVSIVLMLFLVGFFLLGAFSSGVELEYTLDIQAPIAKSYNSLASHELKTIVYSDIDARRSLVHPHQDGDSTILYFTSGPEDRFVKEIVLVKDSLSNYVYSLETNSTDVEVTMQFKDLDRISRVNINEKLRSKSFIDRAMLLVMKSAWKKNRIKLYQSLKTKIESTPDFNYLPEERK